MMYLQYLKYLIRHKWFVMLECFKVGLYWQGIVHDISKFKPDEFFPYAHYFYGQKGSDIKKGRDETGYYKPTDTGDNKFDFAWLLHQKRNPHHWQWWILPEDNGGVKLCKMDDEFVKEMVCDWIGAGKAQGYFSPPEDKYFETRKWYHKNQHKMHLHSETRDAIEVIIGYDWISRNHKVESALKEINVLIEEQKKGNDNII